ncbi:Cobalamin (vitamin B12)-binding domain protein [Acididesulfobacillus acetoxydans]|uniref:Cobalamin (Vitamin B12)-binding domain protein n=1 Tax=Acididesulfobacillus acetoxydans TaxID=1561005 RepID=A0A8S0WX69_9FIRM|nr:cobalamin-dependent protein [Acididesulfobacillus acetoxydans]CAA7600771.1 Cobalamin (vitamin B12)-binding domain protein [Acididesulfobacillus acetoxydans]CEJ08619.1 Methionine synthase [Acididesulfobacillus acetoxydans]
MLDELVNLIADLKEKEAVEAAKKLLDDGADPIRVLERCRMATEIVGKRFEEDIYFIPDMLFSGEILEQISQLAKAKIHRDVDDESYAGKVVIGTVEGDLHDIGKNIVAFLLEANNFKTYDLGVDVSAQKFVDAIREVQPDVVGMSGLLTIAFGAMSNTISVIKQAGLRDKVRIMIGGAPTNEDVARRVGADAYAKDAQQGVELARQWSAVK